MKQGLIIFDCTGLQINVQSVEFDDIANTVRAESSAVIRERDG